MIVLVERKQTPADSNEHGSSVNTPPNLRTSIQFKSSQLLDATLICNEIYQFNNGHTMKNNHHYSNKECLSKNQWCSLKYLRSYVNKYEWHGWSITRMWMDELYSKKLIFPQWKFERRSSSDRPAQLSKLSLLSATVLSRPVALSL